MLRCAYRAAAIFADARVFFRFGEAGQLLALWAYIGERLRLTVDVRRELELNAAKDAYAYLRALDRFPQFRHAAPIELGPDVTIEAARRMRASQRPGDPPNRNAGEVTTILAAREMQYEGEDVLLLVDDDFGVALARTCNLPYLSTAMLAAEMVHRGELDTDLGLRVYEEATPAGVGEREFQAALARVPALCGEPQPAGAD